MTTKTKKIEAILIDAYGEWRTIEVEIPASIYDLRSQDAYLNWAYRTQDGEKFRKTWRDTIIGTFVWRWGQ